MATGLLDSKTVQIPKWVVDLPTFREWADTDEFPEDGRIWFVKGQVWVDMSKEQIFTHIQVKSKYATTLIGLGEREELGMFVADGLLISNEFADFSGKPDGTFITYRSLEKKRAVLVEGKSGGFVELLGTPDMVLEVVSKSSVHKDTVSLKEAYWEAGIQEYWLVDAREEPIEFNIFKHSSKGYSATRQSKGWLKSNVFGKSFQLIQAKDKLGYPRFDLLVK